ncbi:hypothetical protein EN904_26190 [Mesorhizobium sp. M7A.F.Ca.CA.001.07.2.1]|uniref:hypothetical protein n=1 Tax=Mesorhizobium TaxID=68287 RepID=UPI000FCCB7AD|nr:MULTISPECIES: hypothetical protein [Mesorhizobium]RVB34196.1 hypothetical protein EN918_17710 [Mesorhizobium sp. M7A.F.Ca.CA.004.05.1.1]MCF6122189.1 hypothetical protein [Mesorhizobium ciceri]MCQ8812771.1 hypothetical protein [Mesorhizobium sp. SEMIA396]RUX80772.1 hypothetical protein EN983_07050 [Mesorhizobium sp. M7A.F.Ca.CA.004.08.2.1]RUX87059.1 hypothetical protein EN982_12485 [Mesorhizobium sp. M7A.F.Ca.CA.004.08.1.1]
MTVNCRLSIDNRPEATDAVFQAVPRIGESVALSIDGTTQDLRVSRVVHVTNGSLEGAAIIVEVTTNIL